MNTYYIAGYPVSDELYHHGILGQKWGIRRYQNADGTLTADGKIRYGGNARTIQRDLNRLDREKAYIVGDRSKVVRKYFSEMRKLNRHKDKNDEWKEKHQLKADSANEKKKTFEKRYDELANDTQKLIQNAIDQGMNVRVTDIPRSTMRTGERVARESLAWAMAFSMAAVAPVGIGVSTVQYTKGSNYKVRKPKE